MRNKSKKTKSQKRKIFGISIILGTTLCLAAITTFVLLHSPSPSDGKKPVLGVTINGVPSNPAFTDPIFYACILNKLNYDKVDAKSDRTYAHPATDAELAQLKTLSCTNYNKADNLKIANTAGLNKLTGLTELRLDDNRIESIDVTKNVALTKLTLESNKLTAIDVTKNIALTYLDLNYNAITSIDVTKNVALTDLELWDNQLTTIDVTKNVAVTYLDLDDNPLTSIDLTKNVALNEVYFHSDNLTTVDFSGNVNIEFISFEGNKLTNINVSKNAKLIALGIYSESLTSLDVSGAIALDNLELETKQLSSIDISKNIALTGLGIASESLTTLDASGAIALKGLYLETKQLSSIDISKNLALTYLEISSESLTYIDVSKNIALNGLGIASTQLSSIDVSKNIALENLSLTGAKLTSVVGISELAKLSILDIQNTLVSTIDIRNNAVLKTFRYANNPNLTAILTSKSTDYTITPDGKNILVNDTDIATILNKISTVPIGSEYVVHFGSSTNMTTGALISGDKLLIKQIGTNTILNTYNLSNITISTGSLSTTNFIIKKSLNDKASSIDLSVFTSTAGTDTITSKSIVDSANVALASDAVLKTGDKVQLKLSSGATIDYKISILGDVAPDGSVQFTDVVKLFRHYKGVSLMANFEEITAGDVVADGQIQFTDVVKLFRYYKGIISTL